MCVCFTHLHMRVYMLRAQHVCVCFTHLHVCVYMLRSQHVCVCVCVRVCVCAPRTSIVVVEFAAAWVCRGMGLQGKELHRVSRLVQRPVHVCMYSRVCVCLRVCVFVCVPKERAE